MNKLLALSVAVAYATRSIQAASIYEFATESEDFTSLANLLELAGLADSLTGEGTFTVFAPTNPAFDELPDATVDKLTNPVWKPQLRDVLLYHAIDSVVGAADLVDGMVVTTLNGETITINTDPPRVNGNSMILVGDGLVDIEADNGIVHGVDAVLAPTSLSSNIIDIAVGDSRFSTLVAAVTAAGLGDALMGEGPLTVFAPTDEAFENLPDGVLADLLMPENVDTLTDILKYHVLAANAASSTLSSGSVQTTNGNAIEVDVSDSGVMVNDANVIDADIIANNGIIHAIDTVLIPPTDELTGSIYDMLSNLDDFSTLVDLLDIADLSDALTGNEGALTLFAPINDAFDEVPEEIVTKLTNPVWKPQLRDILLYHLLGSVVASGDLVDGMTSTTLNGEDITINTDPPRVNGDSIIIVDELVDVEATNGIVHGISHVLAPTSLTSNVVDIAVNDERFSTLVAAVTAAGLGDALTGEGPVTVFAPTNEAFENLPVGVLGDLLQPKNIDSLSNILKYHVVAANAASSTLSSGNIQTLNGESVKLEVHDAGIVVNGANVIDADIIAENGILHVIDAVLIPPTDAPTKSPTLKPQRPKPSKSSKESKSSKSSKASKSCKSSKSSKALKYGKSHKRDIGAAKRDPGKKAKRSRKRRRNRNKRRQRGHYFQ